MIRFGWNQIIQILILNSGFVITLRTAEQLEKQHLKSKVIIQHRTQLW